MTQATAEVSAAAAALAEMTPSRRAGLLEAVAERIELSTDQLVATAIEETFLGESRLAGEITRTTNQLRLFADVVRDGSFLELPRQVNGHLEAVSSHLPDTRSYGPVVVTCGHHEIGSRRFG